MSNKNHDSLVAKILNHYERGDHKPVERLIADIKQHGIEYVAYTLAGDMGTVEGDQVPSEDAIKDALGTFQATVTKTGAKSADPRKKRKTAKRKGSDDSKTVKGDAKSDGGIDPKSAAVDLNSLTDAVPKLAKTQGMLERLFPVPSDFGRGTGDEIGGLQRIGQWIKHQAAFPAFVFGEMKEALLGENLRKRTHGPKPDDGAAFEQGPRIKSTISRIIPAIIETAQQSVVAVKQSVAARREKRIAARQIEVASAAMDAVAEPIQAMSDATTQPSIPNSQSVSGIREQIDKFRVEQSRKQAAKDNIVDDKLGFTKAFQSIDASAGLYSGLFDSLKAGKDTFAGAKDPILKAAKPYFDAGLISDPGDLKALYELNFPPLDQRKRGGGQVSGSSAQGPAVPNPPIANTQSTGQPTTQPTVNLTTQPTATGPVAASPGFFARIFGRSKPSGVPTMTQPQPPSPVTPQPTTPTQKATGPQPVHHSPSFFARIFGRSKSSDVPATRGTQQRRKSGSAAASPRPVKTPLPAKGPRPAKTPKPRPVRMPRPAKKTSSGGGRQRSASGRSTARGSSHHAQGIFGGMFGGFRGRHRSATGGMAGHRGGIVSRMLSAPGAILGGFSRGISQMTGGVVGGSIGAVRGAIAGWKPNRRWNRGKGKYLGRKMVGRGGGWRGAMAGAKVGMRAGTAAGASRVAAFLGPIGLMAAVAMLVTRALNALSDGASAANLRLRHFNGSLEIAAAKTLAAQNRRDFEYANAISKTATWLEEERRKTAEAKLPMDKFFGNLKNLEAVAWEKLKQVFFGMFPDGDNKEKDAAEAKRMQMMRQLHPQIFKMLAHLQAIEEEMKKKGIELGPIHQILEHTKTGQFVKNHPKRQPVGDFHWVD